MEVKTTFDESDLTVAEFVCYVILTLTAIALTVCVFGVLYVWFCPCIISPSNSLQENE